MRRQVRLHPVRAFIAHREQQGGGLAGNEEADMLVHAYSFFLFGRLGKFCQQEGGGLGVDDRKPPETLGQGIESP